MEWRRDIKSANILLGSKGVAKIADVGLARVLSETHVITETIGTLHYAAPELLLGKKINEKVDIYSFGVVLWEIVTGEQAFRCQLRDVRVKEECPQAIANLIDACVECDPDRRPSAEVVLQRLQAAPHPKDH